MSYYTHARTHKYIPTETQKEIRKIMKHAYTLTQKPTNYVVTSENS